MQILQKRLGFTLVEVMVVVAILAIVAAIAFPSYARYARSGSEGRAQSALGNIAQQTSDWRLRYKTYQGFVPQDYLSDASPGDDYYIPEKLTPPNHSYHIVITDDGGTPIRTASTGNSWVMYAFPNVSKGNLKYADAMILDSADMGCSIDRSDGNPADMTALKAISCADNNSKIQLWN